MDGGSPATVDATTVSLPSSPPAAPPKGTSLGAPSHAAGPATTRPVPSPNPIPDLIPTHWDRPALRPKYVEVLFDVVDACTVAVPSARARTGSSPRRRKRPALSSVLLRCIEAAGLHRISTERKLKSPHNWRVQLEAATENIEIAPGVPLRRFWFTQHGAWTKQIVARELSRTSNDWPKRHVPQAFLCWTTDQVGACHVPLPPLRNRYHHHRALDTHVVPVSEAVVRPIIGYNPVQGPYLFIGAVARPSGKSDYECIRAFAQPIVSMYHPVPVDSENERRAFNTLRGSLGFLKKDFPDTTFELTKPLFSFNTELGPCIPDFLIDASDESGRVRFVVEVMGFDRASYLGAKERTHPRMELLGTLCLMDATRFTHDFATVVPEGRRVTQTIRNALRTRRADAARNSPSR